MANHIQNQEDDDPDFSAPPADFPTFVRVGALPGAQPKFLAVKYNDHFYQLGASPPEVYVRWRRCEDIAEKIADKSIQFNEIKRTHMSEVEILDYYLSQLIARQWVTEAEARWTIRRVSEMLSWPITPAALEPAAPAVPGDLE